MNEFYFWTFWCLGTVSSCEGYVGFTGSLAGINRRLRLISPKGIEVSERIY